MTLNISQFRKRIAHQFPDAEQVDDSVIRFTKRAGDLPYAVYCLDVAQDLPESQETLTKYQDRVIGSHYFEGRKSLQWNNYLYFVTSAHRLASSDVRLAKELIERDRTYARKFVISEEELDSVLTPPVVAPAHVTPRTNVLSVWIEHLIEAGLDKAILSDDDLPTRLKLIESSSTKSTTGTKAPRRNVVVRDAPFIRSLQLEKFRDFPLQRNFEFGSVNLIFGVNGSGKTCLLEAIELFYSGRNKRNPATKKPYELTAVLADGRTERATDRRGLKTFRVRNLEWYGQSEVKTNNLYQSFAQFNFLDTDAAVSLSESTSRIEEDLSKLLVGPDASKTWKNIERVREAVAAKLRDLRPLQKQITEELEVLEQRLVKAAEVTQESDLVHARLEDMNRRAGWDITKRTKEEFSANLIAELSELLPLVQQAVAIGWTESPVSTDGLVKYCHEYRVAGEKTEADLARLELLRKNQKRHAEASKRCQEALKLLDQVRRLMDAEVPIRAAEIRKLQTTVDTNSGWLVGLDSDALGSLLSTIDLDVPLPVYHDGAASMRSAAETLLEDTQREYANFTKLRDQALNLAQELREAATKILQNSQNPDECPLCHTQFGPGELAKHMNVGVDEHLEALGRSIITQLRERERVLREATAVETMSSWLKNFCERAGLAVDISVRSGLSEVEDAKRNLADARDRLETLTKEMDALESQGLSAAKLEEISARLGQLGYRFSEPSREGADRLRMTIDQDLATSSRTLETEMKQVDELEQTLEAILGPMESGVHDPKRALSRLKERLAATESIVAKLGNFSSSFPWPGARPLAELVVEAESLRKVAAELQAALNRERQAKATHTESIKRKEQLKRRLDELAPQMKRFSEAQVALDKLQKEYSLTEAMRTALQQNRDAIEAIFSRIHSPAEFRGLGSNLATLIRKVNGREATLKEISTGQRAAFALSIFLAQNAQLTVAPPVVLIDDPIAHVDDLNSLSFLDYLREIVLTGRRQIFFATASDKLAALFERKFDFLGADGFRTFNLTREPPSATSDG